MLFEGDERSKYGSGWEDTVGSVCQEVWHLEGVGLLVRRRSSTGPDVLQIKAEGYHLHHHDQKGA